jgi:hypothetical protein
VKLQLVQSGAAEISLHYNYSAMDTAPFPYAEDMDIPPDYTDDLQSFGFLHSKQFCNIRLWWKHPRQGILKCKASLNPQH